MSGYKHEDSGFVFKDDIGGCYRDGETVYPKKELGVSFAYRPKNTNLKVTITVYIYNMNLTKKQVQNEEIQKALLSNAKKEIHLMKQYGRYKDTKHLKDEVFVISSSDVKRKIYKSHFEIVDINQKTFDLIDCASFIFLGYVGDHILKFRTTFSKNQGDDACSYDDCIKIIDKFVKDITQDLLDQETGK